MNVPVEDLLRDAAPRVLAALARRSADPEAARDALQEALLAATVQWPREGFPADPTAWLVTVASRRLTDQVRADRSRAHRERRLAELAGSRRTSTSWRPPPTRGSAATTRWPCCSCAATRRCLRTGRSH